MTTTSAKKLKVGDRVRWAEFRHDSFTPGGEVIETGHNAVKVRWDDGVIGLYLFGGEGAGGVRHLRVIDG